MKPQEPSMVDSLISAGQPVEWRGPKGRVRSWLVIAWSATLVLIGTGVEAWWRSRPDRHLAEGERLLEENQPDEAIRWLGVPEATLRTRDRAFLLRARAALARNSPSDAMDPLFQVDADGPWAADAAYWKGRTLEAVQQTRRPSSVSTRPPPSVPTIQRSTVGWPRPMMNWVRRRKHSRN